MDIDWQKQFVATDSEYILRLEERLKDRDKKITALEKQIQDLEIANESLREEIAGDDW